ncbi:arylesterase [Hydrogenovibrio sp. 3SP14C1]|uniref:arylesterase n=1 Tax=Hydrogenovibrio sp. 3SP14C1 TaxID=3038774 RepID=UPI002416CF26|nr:arylesterase [Hydrogenovibrio sp. 3SP14C1]MDG4811787.1 arylesterase [Hydrogenovibrio sp. 3SP14C1]
MLLKIQVGVNQVILILFLAILGYSSVTQAVEKPNIAATNSSQTLLVLGDSLSAAYGMSVEQGWVTLLANKLQKKNINVVNASISGETTSGGKNRLPKLLKDYQPNWIIVELGANDALRGQALQTTQRNLQTIIDLSQETGAKTLLLGIRLPTNYGPAYDQMLQQTFKRVASKNQLLFAPFFLETVALEPDLMQEDGLHPNASAQPKILDHLWPLIQELITSSAKQAA